MRLTLRDRLTRTPGWQGIVLDLGLLAAGILMVVTDLDVLFFHVIFLLLTVVAFSLALRRLTLRVAVWASVASLDLFQAVQAGIVDPVELIEIPLMLIIIGLVFLIASRREAYRRRLSTFESIIRGASDVVVLVDPGGLVRYASPATEGMLGYRPDELEGKALERVLAGDDRALFDSVVTGGVDGPAVAEHGIVTADGEQRRAETTFTDLRSDPLVGGMVLTIRDVTERYRLRQELARLALHDSLTGLPNRAQFTDRLEASVIRARSTGGAVGLLFLDLDNFKDVNDRLGHHAGDRLLMVAGERVRAQLRGHDMVARFGGDEFVVLLDELRSRDEASDVADRVVAAFDDPVEIDGELVRVSTSVGVACAVGVSASTDLLRQADMAMYRAKARGGGQREVFSSFLPGEDAPMAS